MPALTPDDEWQRTTMVVAERVRRGDHDAFAILIDKYGERLRRSVASQFGVHLRDLCELDDILQEAATEAFLYVKDGRFQDFDRVGGFLWLMAKIAKQRIRDQGRRIRAEKRDPRRRRPVEDADTEALTAREPRPSQVARARELEGLREAAFLQLDERDRQVIDMRDNLLMDYTEIAGELGCKYENAKLRYSRAKQKWNRLAKQALAE